MRKYKIEQLNLLLCLFCVVRRRMTCERREYMPQRNECSIFRKSLQYSLSCVALRGVYDLPLASSRSQWIHWCSELNAVHWSAGSSVTLRGVHASSHSAIVAVQRLGKRFISGFACSLKKGLSEVEKDGNYKRLAKFKESAWKFVYYLTAETLALTITYNEPWFKDTKQFWIGPDQQCWPDQKAK